MGTDGVEPNPARPDTRPTWVSRFTLLVLAAFAGAGLLASRENVRLRRERENLVPLTRSDLFMVSHLVSQYTRGRAEAGDWPHPGQIVKELPLIGSKRDARYPMRVDTYRASRPEAMVHIQLYDDGALFIKVDR